MYKERFKKMIGTTFMTIAVLISALVPLVSGQDVNAATTLGKTRSEAVAWCKDQIGKGGRDYDGAAGVQCVDLIRYYTTWLGKDIGRCAIEGYANDYQSQSIPDAYTRYGNSTAPQPGDIFVWGKGAYGASSTTGHVGIIYEVGSDYYKYIDYVPKHGNTPARGALGTTQKNGKQNFSKIIRPNFKPEIIDPAPAVSNQATIKDGTYMLRNVGSNYAMNYAYGKEIIVWLSVYGDEATDEQHFTFTHDGNGKYKINVHGANNVVNCECALPVVLGSKITVRKYTNNDTQKFYVTPMGDGTYLFQSANNPNYVIGAPSGNKHAELELQAYQKGNKLQLWSFDPNPNPTSTPTPTPTNTPTPTPTNTPTPTSTPTPKPTATSKPTVTPTKAPKVTATPTPTTKPASKNAKVLDFVNRIYKFVLDREPEKEGAAFWTDELVSLRKTGAEVAQGFIFSDEFVNRKTNDIQFVTILYKTFFGRDPEADGLDYWVGMLKSGEMDRTTVANGFIFSQEWTDTCAKYGIKSGAETSTPAGDKAPTAATVSFVERMYTTALNRSFDKQGRDYWASELANLRITGESLGLSFFLSDEMNSLKLNDKEFINRLYKTFMDREADAAGETFWQKFLKGHSRNEAVLGFTRSEEFVKKCVDAQILPY